MQEYYQESSRKIPVVESVDVLVCGGGPAGFAAAVTAARAGARVMVLEKFNSIGGMATSGMMSHWAGNHSNPLQQEVYNRSSAIESLPETTIAHESNHIIPHEAQKTAMQAMLQEAGVIIQLHTMVVDAIMDGDRVRGVVTESKSGREAIYAKVVIDATGDGDVAAFAGAEYLKGREDDHICQPVTLMFRIGGVDWDRAIFPGSFETLVDVPKGEIQNLGKSILPRPAGHVLLYRSKLPGEVVVNMTNVINCDGTDVRQLTAAELTCREQIEKIIPFLREYAPGYEHCYLVSTADNVGIRETRHFKGVYTLTPEDVVQAKVFEDWIATKNFFNFDIHSLKGPGLDENGAQNHFKANGTYTVPYRACLPIKVDGLLLSGRNISGTHKAHSNYRVMGICLAIGQGVGAAAAIAAKHDILPRDVDVKEVQKFLLDSGVEL